MFVSNAAVRPDEADHTVRLRTPHEPLLMPLNSEFGASASLSLFSKAVNNLRKTHPAPNGRKRWTDETFYRAVRDNAELNGVNAFISWSK